MMTVDGHIVDVAFNKNTGVLYYLTSDPHRLNIFDINAREVLGVVELAKDPTCFAISEDWLTAAVGHYGAVSAVNLSNRTKVATHSIDYSVNDIAWAENDWYAFTQKGGSDPCLHWVNLADGSCCDAVDNTGLDGSTIVKKVPTQPYLVATRNVTFPTGFYAYDIAGKVLKSYSHMDLTDFWFSDDGRLIFAKNTNIYRTSSSTGSDNTFNTKINPVGKINTGGNEYYGLKHLFYGANSLWVLQNESSSSDTPTALYQVEREGYSVVKRIPYDFLYQPDGASTFFSVSANYAFANREESEIAVLCKGINNDSWVIQFVSVE